MANKTCNECVSRFICPNNYRPCDGWNDEEVFWSLLKLAFMDEARIERYRALVKGLQMVADEMED